MIILFVGVGKIRKEFIVLIDLPFMFLFYLPLHFMLQSPLHLIDIFFIIQLSRVKTKILLLFQLHPLLVGFPCKRFKFVFVVFHQEERVLDFGWAIQLHIHCSQTNYLFFQLLSHLHRLQLILLIFLLIFDELLHSFLFLLFSPLLFVVLFSVDFYYSCAAGLCGRNYDVHRFSISVVLLLHPLQLLLLELLLCFLLWRSASFFDFLWWVVSLHIFFFHRMPIFLRFFAALFIDISCRFFLVSHNGSLLLISILKGVLALATLSLPAGGTLDLIGATTI